MQAELEQLDALAVQRDLDVRFDSRAVDLMEALFEKGRSLNELLERYGNTRSDYILISLAAVVTRHAGESAEPFPSRPVFRLVEIQRSSDIPPNAIRLCLNAVSREIFSVDPEVTASLPVSATRLVFSGLRCTTDQAWVVYHSALLLLETLCERGLLVRSFSDEQRRSLKQLVTDLQDFAAADLQHEVESVLTCLDKDPSGSA